jgi:hypothetical protein
LLPLLPSLMVAPEVVTVLPVPAFLLVKAKVPPATLSPVARPVAARAPVAEVVPSYVLMTSDVLSVRLALLMVLVVLSA